MTGTPLRAVNNVYDLADGFVEGPAWPVIPDGEYDAVYVGHDCVEMREFARAAKVYVRFRLYDAGDHTGKVLYRAYRAKRILDRKRFVVARRSDLCKTIHRVFEIPAHRTRLDRFSLRELKTRLLRIKTRTVTKDSRGKDLPPALYYSVVEDIVGVVDG